MSVGVKCVKRTTSNKRATQIKIARRKKCLYQHLHTPTTAAS